MFDVGFLEMVVILVLALLVLGPERLPKAARQVGYWFGKARRYVEGVKSQVENEFDGGELKRLIHNQEVQIRELQNKLHNTEDHVNTDYHNMFDDQNDPGTATETKAEKRYEIIEEDDFEEEAKAKTSSREKQQTDTPENLNG
ncbi:MAG: Sec-independent protein translocase protein TatB [Gammaproteobacteria bacterium]|nr:Sec-independent protein translocase protein TatB [Gammaproteobacteria bacterium]